MARAHIAFYQDGKETGRIAFKYGRSIYNGVATTSGPRAAALQKIMQEPHPVYVPDLGGAAAAARPHPEAWSWLLAVAYSLTNGSNPFADSFRVISPPKKKLFRVDKSTIPYDALE